MRPPGKKNHKENQQALERDWQKRAAAEAARSTEQRFRQEIALLNKDGEAERPLAELRIQTLEGIGAGQAAQIAALENQLDEAKQQVQDIAVKAVEGASGAKAPAAISRIAVEQARQRPRTE